MNNYDSMKYKHSKKVCQTLNNPIMVLDYFELGDVMVSLAVLMFFGIVIYSFLFSVIGLTLSLGVIPSVKKRFPKGILFHIPYLYGMSLPGIINPGNDPLFSD